MDENLNTGTIIAKALYIARSEIDDALTWMEELYQAYVIVRFFRYLA